jgi:adenine-specific DNA-methyltransferase
MICELYAPHDESDIRPGERVFFTRRNAAYLDTARALIDKLPPSVGRLLLAPLIAEASVHANTSGVFKGFYKNAEGLGQYGGSARNALGRICGDIEVRLPLFSRFECEYAVHQKDANALLGELPSADLAYIDPPYNQHPYGSNYFLLNLLVDYRRPESVSRVSGIPPGWNRSRYNKRREAAAALFDLISRCPASHCLVSYNSEGFLSQGEFLDMLGRLGRVEVCETSYAAFRGSRNLRKRPTRVKEFLYLLER